MFKQILFLIIFFTVAQANSFLIIDPNYRLSNHKDVVVNIGQGGCQASGITNDFLMNAINKSIEDYWNTVTESELKLRAGGEVDRVDSVPGEILVYCEDMGMSGPSGVAYPSNGSSIIILNGSTFVPGNFIPEVMTGVLAHEMGHAIGLDHSGDNASVMTYEAHDWRYTPKYLSQDDKDGVAYLYPRKGQMGGIIPGCSAMAESQKYGQHFSAWAVFSEILFFALILLSLRFFRKIN